MARATGASSSCEIIYISIALINPPAMFSLQPQKVKVLNKVVALSNGTQMYFLRS